MLRRGEARLATHVVIGRAGQGEAGFSTAHWDGRNGPLHTEGTKMAKEQQTTIILPEIKKAEIQVAVLGETPLIVHAWSEKSKREMLQKQLKEPKGAKQAKDPVQDFEQSLYRLQDGGYGFPSVAFKAAAVTACTSVDGITKVAARQAFHIIGEPIHVKTAFDGRMMRNNLVRIFGSEPEMREDMVRIGMGTADIRYRAQFWPWYATLTVRYNQNVLSESEILNLLNTAGFGVGVGEWRSERDGEYGAFRVADQSEITDFLKRAA